MIIKPKCGMFKGMYRGMGLGRADKVVSGEAPTDYTQDASCQGAWYMNVNQGSELDRSGNGNTLAQYNANFSTSSTVPSGYSGTSRDFIRATNNLYRADGDLVGLDINGSVSMSIVAWIRCDVIANAEEQGIVVKWASSNAQYGMELYGTGTNTFKFNGFVSSNGSSFNGSVSSTTTNYAVGTWYHIAMVYNQTDVRVYVNGSLDCTPTSFSSSIYNGNANFRIANFDDDSWGAFDGLIDEAAVFDRALSSTEVSNIYTNGISGNKGGSD